MMKKIATGVLLGVVAGIIDVVPMIVQKLTWDANIAAFAMWVVVGFLISVTEIRIHAALKGILVAYLVLLPSAVLIGWKEPLSLIPILVMTTILGGALGFSIVKIASMNQSGNK